MTGDCIARASGRQQRFPASATRSLVGIAAVLSLLVLAACGSEPVADSSASTRASTLSTAPGRHHPVEVIYEDHEQSSEGTYNAQAVLVATDPTHIRYSIKGTGFAPMLLIYDGQRLLEHDPEEYRPWILYEAPEEHPDEFASVSSVFTDPDGADFAKDCPSAKVIGHKSLLGRAAVGYHCAARHYADGSFEMAGVIWLDQKTGLLLQAGHMHATVFNEHPRITASTFSTEPPAGAKVQRYAAQKQPGGARKQAPDFDLKHVAVGGASGGTEDGGSGTATLSDYAHQPLVLAFFVSDLVFDIHGESCPGCVKSLLTLQRLTREGTDPKVLAIQEGDEGKPGAPLIPKGLHIEVANDPGFDVQHAYGLSEQVGFAFIGSDGKVHKLFNKAPTDQQLQDALDALH